jgi:hypothetical protein
VLLTGVGFFGGGSLLSFPGSGWNVVRAARNARFPSGLHELGGQYVRWRLCDAKAPVSEFSNPLVEKSNAPLFRLPPNLRKGRFAARRLPAAGPCQLQVPSRVVARRVRCTGRLRNRNLALCVADSEKLSTPVEIIWEGA